MSMTTHGSTNGGSSALDRWRAKLNATGLPVFARTVREVSHVASSAASSALDLSEVVGKDAGMAARLIQIANSPVFNLQNRQIETINEATVLVGFNSVRELAVSVSVLEDLRKGHQPDLIARLMVRAFHAATQAKSLAQTTQGESGEEVFVAALLKQVGQMAFWAKADSEATELNSALHNSGQGFDNPGVEKEILGFTLTELGKSLSVDWSLGELLTAVLSGRALDSPLVQSVNVSHQLVDLLEKHNIQSEQATRFIASTAKKLKISAQDLTVQIEGNMQAAEELIAHMGLTLSTGESISAAVDAPIPTPPNLVVQAVPEEYDANDVLVLLQRIAVGLDEGLPRDELMIMLLQGMYKHLHYDQVYFALFTPKRDRLIVKYVAADEDQVAEHGVKMGELIDIAKLPGQLQESASKRVVSIESGEQVQHVAMVQLQGRHVGVLYGHAASQISANRLLAFQQMAQQIAFILSLAKGE